MPFRKDGRWFYSRTVEGQQYPILCRTAVEPPSDLPEDEAVPGEQILLDINVLAGDSDYFALGAYDLAPARTASSTPPTTTGRSATRCAFRDLRTGTDLDDVIPDTTYGIRVGGRRHLLLRAARRRPCGRTRCGATARHRSGRRRARVRGPRRAVLRRRSA